MGNSVRESENYCSDTDFSVLLNFSKGANSRKKILNELISSSKSCNQIATDLDLNWRTAYRHLQILEKECLVKNFGFGERKFYKITLKGKELMLKYSKNENVSTGVDQKNISNCTKNLFKNC